MIPREIIIEMAQFVLLTMGQTANLDNLPEVKAVSPTEIAEVICATTPPEKLDSCLPKARNLGALYIPRTNTLYYNSVFLKIESNPVHRSYIPHELAHWVQGPVESLNCEQLKKRETEAYIVQDAYLKTQGIEMNFAEKFQERFKCEEK